jgi:hypothetical protein
MVTKGNTNSYVKISGRRKRHSGTEKQLPKLLPSETKEYLLMQVYLDVIVPTGVKRVRAAVDTQSNVSYARDILTSPRAWRTGEAKHVKGITGTITTTRPTLLKVLRHEGHETSQVTLDTRDPPKQLFDHGCGVLLSMAHVRELGLDLNAAAETKRHTDAVFLPRESEAKPHLMDSPPRTCRLTEKVVAAYMKARGNQRRAPKQVTLDDVILGADLNKGQKQEIRSIVHEHAAVFALTPDDLPPPMKGVEPHQFKLKPNAVLGLAADQSGGRPPNDT